WLSHGQNDKETWWDVPLDKDDPWPSRTMRILRTRRDPTRPPGDSGPPSFINTETHWWDASQLYGSDSKTAAKVRSRRDGKLTLGSDGLLPLDQRSEEHTSELQSLAYLVCRL